MISSKLHKVQTQNRKYSSKESNKGTKKSSLKSSKTKNNTSIIDQNMQKSSGKKLVSNSNSIKKKKQNIQSPNDKKKLYKQNNYTPLKNQYQYLQNPSLYFNISDKKKSISGLKNIKKKIIGDVGYKTDRQQIIYHMMPLKQKSQNYIQMNASKFYQDNSDQITDEHQYKIITKTSTKNNYKFKKESFVFGPKLGKGRFGDVYIAQQIVTGFGLAIKVMNKSELKQSEMEYQLIQQIKTQTFCTHPNILKMYGFFSDEDNIYLLLQLGTHNSLFQQLKQNRYFPQEIASHFIKEVSAGVGYLHRNGIIHRDIKPENIINCFGVLKLCDFGWAIYSPIYQRQTFCGTLDYVSPQIVTGEYYDQKVDIWCLGVLCYELCTGKAPFESKNNKVQVYNKILNVEIEYPITLSLSVVDLLGKILDKDPKRRINLKEIEKHEWIKYNQNQIGIMIRKEIWDSWVKICR